MLNQHMELRAGPTTRQIFSEICFFASVRLREKLQETAVFPTKYGEVL